MKKISILLVFLSFAFVASAKEVSYDEALQTASEFFAPASSSKKQIKALKQNLSLSTTFKQTQESNKPAFYIFNNGENGFVIVSADDNAKQILGYSNHGAFDAKNIPSNVQFWLNRYAEEITHIAKNKITKPLYANNTKYQKIDPLLGEIEHDQNTPYNNLCPNQYPTGCAATAAGQIMTLYKYPTKGKGTVSYDWNGTTLSANLDNSTYDWNNILPKYTNILGNTNYNATQATEVATLLRDIGYASKMNYSSGGSGTSDQAVAAALVNNFDYDKSLHRSCFNTTNNGKTWYWQLEEDVMEEIYAELQAGRPIFFAGQDPSGGGHAFVCDGINAEGKLHINWGWDGNCNAYYELTSFNPGPGGTGSGKNGIYTADISFLTNIQKNQGTSGVAQSWGFGSLEYKQTTNTFSKTDADDRMLFEDPTGTIYQLGYQISHPYMGYSIYEGTTHKKSTYASWKSESSIVVDNQEFDIGQYVSKNWLSMQAKLKIKDLVSDVSVGAYDLYLSSLPSKTSNVGYPVYIQNRGKVKNHIAVGKDNVYIYPASTNYTRANNPTNLKAENNTLSWSGNASNYMLLIWDNDDLTVEKIAGKSKSGVTDITKKWAVFACETSGTVTYATSDIAYYDGNTTTDEDEEEFRDYLQIPTPLPANIEDYKDGLPNNDDFKITEQETTLCTWNKSTSWTVKNENIAKDVSDLGANLAATRCFIYYNGNWEYADKANNFISEWKQDNTSVTFSKPPEDITESNSKIYCVFVSYIKNSTTNFVKNGSFDDYEYQSDPTKLQNEYGFQSDYTWGNANPGGFDISTEVGKTISNGDTRCDGRGDHTKGPGKDGKYFIANGPNDGCCGNPAGETLLWQRTIAINTLTGRYFAFSCWGQRWCGKEWPNPAKIQWKVNDKNLGDLQNIDYEPCEWKQISAIWERIDDPNITLSLHNEELNDNGNDFGLDDIFFGPCEVRVDIVKVTLGQRVDQPTEGTLSLCSILEVQQTKQSIIDYIKELYPSPAYKFDENQIDENKLDDFEVIIQKKIKCGDGTETTFDWKKLRVSYETNTEKEWKSDRPKPYDPAP